MTLKVALGYLLSAENLNIYLISDSTGETVSIVARSVYARFENIKFLEVLSIAEGKVIPQGRIKYIQHLEGGIVEEILIKEGQKVETSQPLVILSKEKASSEFEEINSRLKSINLSTI